jgi:Uma2 family endonuclease
MSTSTTALLTADELLRLPRGQYRYELINGELKTMSPSGHTHGRITMRIASPLAQFVWKHKLGEVFAAETGFRLTRNPDTVLAPDISFIREERARELRESKGYWPGPPDLAVEVVSPSEFKTDVKAKVMQWLHYGAKEVWVVDSKEETVTVHKSATDFVTLRSEQELVATDLLPGFRIQLSDIFSRELRLNQE